MFLITLVTLVILVILETNRANACIANHSLALRRVLMIYLIANDSTMYI